MSDLNEQMEKIISKSHRSLETARRNFDVGDYDFASSRAYYAVFYAIEGILLTKNMSFSKHSAVISAFNQYFIKEGIFPKEFSKLLSRLFRERQIGDYSFEPVITKEDAYDDIVAAEEIVYAIENYLKDNNYLTREE